MSNVPAQQRVKEQFERWPYPEPIVDLEAWLTRNWQWFDPSHATTLLWPEGRQSNDLEILIAGCGTNQAAVFAINNPKTRVVGIDVSQAALEHHQALKERYGLDNLELKQLPIEQTSILKQSFDLIISTGVLHHLDDPGAGLSALGRCLKPMGCIGLMLYARYGRIGVDLVQQIAQELELKDDDNGLAVLKACLQHSDPYHPLRGYFTVAKDLGHNAGLIDTFLPKREHCYSVKGCLDVVTNAGLIFQNWLFNSPYYPSTNTSQSDAFITKISALPIEQQWAVMERLNTRNACHVFMACESSREIPPPGLPQADLLERVPVLRHPFKMRTGKLHRHQQLVELREHNADLMTKIDGKHTVAELCLGNNQALTVNTLAELWRLDVIAFTRQPGGC